MPNKLTNLPIRANSDVDPMRFVMLDPTTDFRYVVASGTNQPIGVTQVGTKFAPGLAEAFGGSSTIAGTTDDNVAIQHLGDLAAVQVASGATIVNGDYVTHNRSAADGRAQVATSGLQYGGIALESGAYPQDILILVCYGKV